MEDKSNDPTPQRPAGGQLFDAPLLVLDLPALLAQVRLEPAYRTSDRNALTVFKTDGMRIVLLALHAGAELKTHTAPGIISVQVLKGRQEPFLTALRAEDELDSFGHRFQVRLVLPGLRLGLPVVAVHDRGDDFVLLDQLRNDLVPSVR